MTVIAVDRDPIARTLTIVADRTRRDLLRRAMNGTLAVSDLARL